MIDELQIAFVARHAIGLATLQDVQKHLVRIGPRDVDGAITDLHRGWRR